eukprot:3266591-Amphidinium_carterae.2
MLLWLHQCVVEHATYAICLDRDRPFGVHTGRKNINDHALRGKACRPLQRKKRAKLEPGFVSVPSIGAGSESQPAGIGYFCRHHWVAKTLFF